MIGRFLSAILLMGMAAAAGAQVLTYHADAQRRGNFVEPALTWQAAQRLHSDPAFRPGVSGHIYAQPLYWRGTDGRALLVIATESDTVYALDAASGARVWMRRLGIPVPLADLPSCSGRKATTVSMVIGAMTAGSSSRARRSQGSGTFRL